MYMITASKRANIDVLSFGRRVNIMPPRIRLVLTQANRPSPFQLTNQPPSSRFLHTKPSYNHAPTPLYPIYKPYPSRSFAVKASPSSSPSSSSHPSPDIPSSYTSFRSINEPVEGPVFKEKGSKFLNYAFPISSEKESKKYLEQIKKQHPRATHHCWAHRYISRKDYQEIYRTVDDGEPCGSAGVPIYNAMRELNVMNILIIIVRYYGGVKLGVSGLIKAYKDASKNAIEYNNNSNINNNLELYYNISIIYNNFNYQGNIYYIISQYNGFIYNMDMDDDGNTILYVKVTLSNLNHVKSSIYQLSCHNNDTNNDDMIIIKDIDDDDGDDDADNNDDYEKDDDNHQGNDGHHYGDDDIHIQNDNNHGKDK